MIFFSVSAGPEPAGLILTAVEAARRRAMQSRRRRRAELQADRLLARLRRDLDART